MKTFGMDQNPISTLGPIKIVISAVSGDHVHPHIVPEKSSRDCSLHSLSGSFGHVFGHVFNMAMAHRNVPLGGAEVRFSKPRQVQLYLSTAHQSAVADEKMKWFQYISVVINSVASVANARSSRSSIWWFISFEPIPKLGYFSYPIVSPVACRFG